MKPELAQHLHKVGATVMEVDRIVSSHTHPRDKRTVLLLGLLNNMTQYHRSALQLTKSGAFASAYALTRAIVRDLRYGLWISSCASEEQIIRIEKDGEFPLSIPEMTRKVEAAYSADHFFQNLKDRWGSQLNKYSIANAIELGLWEIDASSGLHSDDEEIRDVTTAATLCIVLLAAKFLASHGHSADCKQIEALAADYADRGEASSA